MPSPERWRRIERVFEGAVVLPEARRADFLDRACDGDADLRQSVESLLDADRRAGSFLAHPTRDARGVAPEESAGNARRRIGPYRLIRPLGQGGMAAVYLATRDDDEFERRVAIKLVRAGLATEAWRQRLRAERQILARLDHPNIARMYDGGSDDGVPYVVMEAIDGEPIDRFCDQNRYSLAARIDLIRQVCGAVQYAHRNLIVHRDIKPSNILVTPDGTPKLLDFGIAKLLAPSEHGSDGDSTVSILRPMTPSYASPEQLFGGPITTATDVYALGVLLYTLLCGDLPHHYTSLEPAAVAKVHAIRPRVPSAVVRARNEENADEARTLAADRRVSPAQLARALSGELDDIASMALRREPDRRYASVERLADDLRRHRQGFPVAARGASLGYRFATFVRRHRMAASATAALLLAALIGGTIFASQASRIARQNERYEQILETFDELVSGVDPFLGVGKPPTVEEALEGVMGKIRRDLADRPADLATLLTTIGRVYGRLGNYGRAQSVLEDALALRRAALGEDALAVGETAYVLAYQRYLDGRHQAAEAAYRIALPIYESRLGPWHEDLADLVHDMALLARHQEDLEAAESYTRRGLEIRERLLGATHPKLARSYNHLGIVHGIRGDYETAESYILRGIELIERSEGAEAFDLYRGLSSAGVLYQRTGRPEKAEPFLLRSVEILEKHLGAEHPTAATARHNLATLYLQTGRLEAAETSYLRALRGVEGKVAAQSLFRLEILNGLGSLYRRQGRLDEAEARLAQVLRAFDNATAEERAGALGSLVEAYRDLALIDERQGETDSALTHWRTLRDLARPRIESASIQIRSSHALALLALNELDAARRWLEEIRVSGHHDPELAARAESLGLPPSP